MKKPEKTSLVAEAEALLAIAKVIESLSKEQACAVLAQACAHFGFYDEGREFLSLAKQASEL